MVTAGFPRGARAPVGGSAETVMNPSVADTKRYTLINEATDEVNGLGLLALHLLVVHRR